MKKQILTTIALCFLLISCSSTKTIEKTNTTSENKQAIQKKLSQSQINKIDALLNEHDGKEGIEQIRKIVKSGDIINVKYSYKTALMWASEYGYAKIVSILITAGSDINAISKDMQTALNLAQKNKHEEVVKILTNAGAKK